MIWMPILASPIFVAHSGVETLQHLEEEYWSKWEEQPVPAFLARDASGQKLEAIPLKPNGEDEPVQGWRIGIVVEPQARGQRVGQHVLERARAFAREKGARCVNLFVDPTTRRAIALYQRVGFVEGDERDQVIEMRINLTKPNERKNSEKRADSFQRPTQVKTSKQEFLLFLRKNCLDIWLTPQFM
jgi:ribosomal protein S18 acetylase RimI-like enzyme